MAMNIAASTGPRGDINITPLVDVVLVLLIIFMIVTPLLQMGYDVNVPPKIESHLPSPMEDQVIVSLDAAGRVYINKEHVPQDTLAARLRAVLTNRGSKIVFFAADGELPYEQVMDVMDICRNNGAENLGIVLQDPPGLHEP